MEPYLLSAEKGSTESGGEKHQYDERSDTKVIQGPSGKFCGAVDLELLEDNLEDQREGSLELRSRDIFLHKKFAKLSADPEYIAHCREKMQSERQHDREVRAPRGWWLLPSALIGLMAWTAFLVILL